MNDYPAKLIGGLQAEVDAWKYKHRAAVYNGDKIMAELKIAIEKCVELQGFLDICVAALEKIAGLKDMKEMRIPLSTCPTQYMTEDGFEPIHPMMKEGLRIAAKIAEEALDK